MKRFTDRIIRRGWLVAFLLLVSAEHPTEVAHTGAGVSAPTFKRIAERTLEYLRVPPEVAPEAPATGPKSRTAMR